MTVHSQAVVDEVLRLWNDGASAGDISYGFQWRISRNAVIGIVTRARDKLGEAKVRTAAPTVLQRPRKPRATQVRPELPPPRAVVIETRPVAMLERARNQCVWPLWPHEETGAPDFMVCGADRCGERPYCEGHAALGIGAPLKKHRGIWNRDGAKSVADPDETAAVTEEIAA